MIEVGDLSFAYPGGPPVLAGVGFNAPGGVVALIGPNGSGKSTLLRSMMGLLEPQGSVRHRGVELVGLPVPDVVERVSFLPQAEPAEHSLRVREVVLLGRLARLGMRLTPADDAAVARALGLLGISRLADRRVSQLSGGQRKLVSIARTLIRLPGLVLMDEPTNSLDLRRQLELCQLLRRISAAGTDVVVALHDLNLAARFADHVVVLDGHGGVHSHGKPAKVVTAQMLAGVYGVDAVVSVGSDGVPVIAARGPLVGGGSSA